MIYRFQRNPDVLGQRYSERIHIARYTTKNCNPASSRMTIHSKIIDEVNTGDF